MKTDLADKLDLRRMRYAGKYDIIEDKINGKYSALLDNQDLGFVLTADTKEKLYELVKKAIHLHCAMVSIENIESALYYRKYSFSRKVKPSCNILVPA